MLALNYSHSPYYQILFKSAGTMDVPGILLEAPVFERHDVDKNIFSGPGNWPCDDEDDCPQEGSGAYETDGGEKDFYPGQRKHLQYKCH